MKNWIKISILAVLFIGMVLISGCTSSKNPSFYEINIIEVKPQVLPEEYQSIAPGFTYIKLTIKNTASEVKSFVEVDANIYDTNNEFVCHGFDMGRTLQPREKANFFIGCQGAYAADKSLKDPEITIIEHY